MNKLKCELCEFESTSLVGHIFAKHKMSPSVYKIKYNVKSLTLYTDEQIKNHSIKQKQRMNDPSERKKNSERQKNGASCFTEKYWINHGMSEECARNKVRELQISNSKKSQEKITPDRTRFNKLYWISRKGMDEKSAIKKISEIQSELSSRSSKYKGKKSTKERNEKISSTVSKHIKEVGGGEWAKHFGDFSSGVSKIERSFFESIKKETGKELKANVPIGNYIVDVLFGKKVVEFYGDYWHANPNKFDSSKIFYNNKLAAEIWEKDLNRVDWLRSEEYDVMIVWESDWRLDKENCIKRIKEYYGTIN